MSFIFDKFKYKMQPSIRSYEWLKYEEIAPVPDARIDYEHYSAIKIKKFDDKNKYVEIPLIHSEMYQKLSDPTKYVVLVKYVGSGVNDQAVGEIVRRDVYINQIGSRKTVQDDNVGVI